METIVLKKGDQAIHVNRGPGVLLSDLGGGPNQGTLIRLNTGEEIEASTVYLRPGPKSEPPAAT